LRRRLVAGGVVAIMIALTIAGGGLVLLFERHVARTVAADLDVHLKQLLAGIEVDPQGDLVVTQEPADPRFADPLSGLYWQVSDSRGQLLRSRSLWDAAITMPADDLGTGETHYHDVPGPGRSRMLTAEREASLTAGDRRITIRAVVGVDLARVAAASSAFARDLAVALGILGVVLAVATAVQVQLGLRPLAALRRGVADIRSGRTRHLPAAAPVEVGPLVEEVNALVDAQDEEIERSRSRAADLAHGLKTPLAALAGDAARLHERGEHSIARDIAAVGEAMSRRVDRELARARVRGRSLRGGRAVAAPGPLVQSLIATLARTPNGKRVTFDCRVGDRLELPIDRTDLAEVLGNLLENATRHAAGRVRVVAGSGLAGPPIVVEDDGPGLMESQMPRVLERGARLDERGEGAGLGLAIVQDVLDAYGWRLDLAKSELGGLKATILPKGDDGESPPPALAEQTSA
jgi:signal transduction histidine kinase